ncbi:hypothetical protein AAMO2058_001083500 [Amorphochlora amoebiformis]
MEAKEFDVEIFVYDLSKGMAKAMSKGLVGIQVDGIWHTGVVVYGYEYFYGGGIQSSLPEDNQAGRAVQKLSLGKTTKSQKEFHDFLISQASEWTSQKYHLLRHNCNNFSDACARFLLGRAIPSFITGLPEQVLSTPLGSMIAGYYENMAKSQTHGMVPTGSEGVNLPPIGHPKTTTTTFKGSSISNLGSKDIVGKLIRKVWNENDSKSAGKALNLIRKILVCAVRNPSNVKYQRVKVKPILKRLDSIQGGLDLLKEVGFKVNEGKTHYVFDQNDVEISNSIIAKIDSKIRTNGSLSGKCSMPNDDKKSVGSGS